MIELLRTNDLVLISRVEAILREAGVDFFIADQHMSAMEGSLGFLPRRVLVADEDAGEGARGPGARRASPRNCEMAEPAEAGRADVSGDRRLFRRAPSPAPAGARPSRRDGRPVARRRRAARISRIWPSMSAPASAPPALPSPRCGRRRASASSRSIRRRPHWRAKISPSTAWPSGATCSRPTRLSPARRRAAGLVDAALGSSSPIRRSSIRAARASSPDPDRRRAHVMRARMTARRERLTRPGSHAWIAACLALARPGGALILIHRPEALGAMLGALEGRAGRGDGSAGSRAARTRRRSAFWCAQKRAAGRRCRSRRGSFCTRTRGFTADRRGDPSRRGASIAW